MNSKFFKKNTSLRVILSVALLIPAVVAIIFAINVDPNSVTVNNLKTVTVQTPDGEKYTYSDEKILSIYSAIPKGAKEIDKSFRNFSEETPYVITFEENNAEPIVYKFYALANSEDCVYASPDEKYYLVSSDVAENIIIRDEFASVDSEGFLPALSVSGIGDVVSVAPDKYSWTYTALDGSVSNISGDEKADNPLVKFDFSDSGKLGMSFETAPDSLTVTIKDGEEILFNDKYENLTSVTTILFDHDRVLSLTANAEWYEIEGAEHFGTAEYSFDILYDIEPTYRVLDTGTLPTGDFTVLRMSDFNEGEMLNIENDLGLPTKVTVYDVPGENVKFTFLPLASTLADGEHSLTLKTADGRTDNAVVKSVKRSEYDTQTLIISAEDTPALNDAFSQKALDDFNVLVSKYTDESVNEKLYDGKFEYPTNTSKVVKGGATYGMTRTVMSLNSAGISYVSHGQDLECYKGQSIKAANGGKVVFAGETSLLGNTVIVDHGFSILSYYGNLDSISVKVGDEVKKADTEIGKAGSTGFACVLDGAKAKSSVLCHYAVSLNGIFIAPKSVYNGIYLKY